jgi:hypothetical protein
MASRLVLALGDLFIPDRAAVCTSGDLSYTSWPHTLTGYIGHTGKGTLRSPLVTAPVIATLYDDDYTPSLLTLPQV